MSLAAVLRNVKTDPLAFVQCRNSRPLDVTDMDDARSLFVLLWVEVVKLPTFFRVLGLWLWRSAAEVRSLF